MTRLVAATMTLIALAGCQLPGSAHSGECSNVQIDWVDFVQIGSTQYVGTGHLQEGDLGPVLTHVKFKVDGNVCDPAYRPKDGDAAFLDSGTPIYEVNGRPVGQFVAARHDGVIELYQVPTPVS